VTLSSSSISLCVRLSLTCLDSPTSSAIIQMFFCWSKVATPWMFSNTPGLIHSFIPGVASCCFSALNVVWWMLGVLLTMLRYMCLSARVMHVGRALPSAHLLTQGSLLLARLVLPAGLKFRYDYVFVLLLKLNLL
jgi:hypothetical protein